MQKKKLSAHIREAFLNYFEAQNHSRQPSSLLVPDNDPTLLFTNAGMNQFKNVFTGLEHRPYRRATTSQKCVRAGGKHNDLENVGFTARHHTFFEMLGNFSFGDYFKKDAIHFAWELITKEFGLDKKRLYVSVFKSDDEAADLWHKQEGVPTDRIYRFGEKDNFWRMGESGPCGPCSEIFYDLGPEVGGDPKDNVMGGNGDRYIEFWNLVFMQYNEGPDGQTPLPNPSIDTGLGLERLTAILQGEVNNYHTDLFQDIIAKAADLSGHPYLKDTRALQGERLQRAQDHNIALRVLADHARAAAFLIADGVLPANEGRGYVLRRIMRRALRYGRKLSSDQSLYSVSVNAVIEKMADVFPELRSQQPLITATVTEEENRFLLTLDQGTHLLHEELERLANKGQKTLSGSFAFKLYDTFGFPLDLTHLMAAEKNFQVDQAGFEVLMEKARQTAKASWKGKNLSQDAAHLIAWSQQQAASVFFGYENLQVPEAQLLALSDGTKSVQSLSSGQSGLGIFAKTPFYAESGGQIGDIGTAQSPTGHAEVFDCTKQGDQFVHHLRVVDGHLDVQQLCKLSVLDLQRRRTAANHSATHLLHAALRRVLGTHVTQAGSLVEPDRLRFDFTHSKPLSLEEWREVETQVNAQIAQATEVTIRQMPIKAALAEGAMAMFGEKYGEDVRVIRMGDFSTELCGGTHVSNTAMIRLFKIVGESGVSSGVRRIEALTADRAVQYVLANTWENLAVRNQLGLQQSWQNYLQSPLPVAEVFESARLQIKNLERQVQDLKGKNLDVEALVKTAQEFMVHGQKGRFIFSELPVDDRKVLSQVADHLRDHLGSAVIVLIGAGQGSYPVIVSVSQNLLGWLNAGHILKAVAGQLGGKGGGRADFAQGSVPHREPLEPAKKAVTQFFVAAH